MTESNITGLHGELEKLPTHQLDAMLKAALEQEPPEEQTARLILKILRAREADYPLESNERIDQAWAEYQKKTAPKKLPDGTDLLRTASVLILIAALIFALPQRASAQSLFDRISAWTDSIFELFSPGDHGRASTEYVFRTDHPGLQEVYDTVTELGVTVPVVPMWLPEGYELVECKISEDRTATFLIATFSGEETSFVYELKIFDRNATSQFHKNEVIIETYESNGIAHNIFQNEEMYVTVWTAENIECTIAIDCQKDTLYKVLNSIYTVEE